MVQVPSINNYESSAMHASSVSTSHHPKHRELHKMGWEERKKERTEKRDVKRSLLDMTQLCIHRLTATVVTVAQEQYKTKPVKIPVRIREGPRPHSYSRKYSQLMAS